MTTPYRQPVITPLSHEGHIERVSLDHAGTHYVLYRAAMIGEDLIAVETGWGSRYGQWIILPERDHVAWSYLTEKMPGLREGDRPGYVLLFAAIGIEVF